MSYYYNRPRSHNKQEDHRPKQVKQVKPTIEELLPLPVRPERIPFERKRLICELEEEYIKRYNILH